MFRAIHTLKVKKQIREEAAERRGSLRRRRGGPVGGCRRDAQLTHFGSQRTAADCWRFVVSPSNSRHFAKAELKRSPLNHPEKRKK